MLNLLKSKDSSFCYGINRLLSGTIKTVQNLYRKERHSVKKLIPIIAAVICAVSIFTSCSKDSDKVKDDIEGLVTTTKKTEMFNSSEARPESTSMDSALEKGAEKAAEGAEKLDEDIKRNMENNDKNPD